jgi:hypothetical protein
MAAILAFYDPLEGELPAHALQLPVRPPSTEASPRPNHR